MPVHPAPRTVLGPLRSFWGKRFGEGGGEQAQGPGGLLSIPRAFSCRADLTLIGVANSRGAPSTPGRRDQPASSGEGRVGFTWAASCLCLASGTFMKLFGDGEC